MRAVQWEAPEVLSDVELPVPHAQQGEVVIEVAHCGICGSDLHSFQSGFAARPGQVLGHEFCGTVVEERGVAGVAVGDRVTARPLIPCGRCRSCMAGETQLCDDGASQGIGYGLRGAFAERVLVPRAVLGRTLFALPDEVNDRAGALVEPLAVGLHAVGRAEVSVGETVVVLGAGPIGLAVLVFLRLAAVDRVIVADPSALRREAARRLGAELTIDPVDSSTIEAVAAVTGRGVSRSSARADVVIDCAGVPAAFEDALRLARPGGRVVLCAMYGRKLQMRPDRLTSGELTLRGSVGYRDEFPAVIAALAGGDIDAGALVSHELPLAQIDEAFRIQADPARSLKVLVTPGCRAHTV
jgi:(R,R)-butanediol dehydrogenase/meso-butanediol dehydrogenase/diacetyl reductase